MATKKTEKRIPVVVYTDKRGVFFGYVKPSALIGEEWRRRLDLEDARMAVYWSSDVGGVLGLAAKGPSADCRISPAVPLHVCVDIHGVTRCTDEAVEAWEKAPWK